MSEKPAKAPRVRGCAAVPVEGGTRHPTTPKEHLQHPRHRQLIRLMISGLSAREAAKRVGMQEAGVYMLTRKPSFKEALIMFDSEMFGEADRLLRIAHNRAARQMVRAVGRLAKIMDQKKKDPEQFFRALAHLERITGIGIDRIAAQKAAEAPNEAGTMVNIFTGNPEAQQTARKLIELTRDAQGVHRDGG